jgi:circadian clock protein KaiB
MSRSQEPSSPNATARFERARHGTPTERIELRLYISGLTPNSTRAIADLRRLQQQLPPGCDVEVIDIYQQPERAIEAQIVAVPTLIRAGQGRLQRLIGSLAETTTVLKLLGLVA